MTGKSWAVATGTGRGGGATNGPNDPLARAARARAAAYTSLEENGSNNKNGSNNTLEQERAPTTGTGKSWAASPDRETRNLTDGSSGEEPLARVGEKEALTRGLRAAGAVAVESGTKGHI